MSAYEEDRRVSDPLELKSQAVVSCLILVWVQLLNLGPMQEEYALFSLTTKPSL